MIKFVDRSDDVNPRGGAVVANAADSVGVASSGTSIREVGEASAPRHNRVAPANSDRASFGRGGSQRPAAKS